MTITTPTLAEIWHTVQVPLTWLLIPFLLWLWLRKELTPARLLSIWETDHVLSSRQIFAWVCGVFAMCMYAAGRMDGPTLVDMVKWVAGIFLLGQAPKVIAKLKPSTTVNAENIDEMKIDQTKPAE